MKLPDDVKATIGAFRVKFGDPPMAAVGAPPLDDAARAWMHKLAEQVAISHGPVWGHKSAGDGRPHSADVLAYAVPSAGIFVGWDLWGAGGSADQTFNADPDSLDLTGQVFEPVTPTNWLHPDVPGDPPVDPPTVPPVVPPTDTTADPMMATIWDLATAAVAPAIAAIGAHDAHLSDVETRVNRLVAVVAAQLQAQIKTVTFEGEVSFFGRPVTFTLRPTFKE